MKLVKTLKIKLRITTLFKVCKYSQSYSPRSVHTLRQAPFPSAEVRVIVSHELYVCVYMPVYTTFYCTVVLWQLLYHCWCSLNKPNLPFRFVKPSKIRRMQQHFYVFCICALCIRCVFDVLNTTKNDGRKRVIVLEGSVCRIN